MVAQHQNETLANNLIAYVGENILIGEDPVDADANLMGEGILDSMAMLRLVGYIEEQYGIKIPPEGFVIENFRSLNTVSHYVITLQANEAS